MKMQRGLHSLNYQFKKPSSRPDQSGGVKVSSCTCSSMFTQQIIIDGKELRVAKQHGGSATIEAML